MAVELPVVELHAVTHRCHARWELTGVPPWHQSFVRVGTTAGGWYVEVVSDRHEPTRVWRDEPTAYAVADRWRAALTARLGGEWVRVPCYPTHGWQPGERG